MDILNVWSWNNAHGFFLRNNQSSLELGVLTITDEDARQAMMQDRGKINEVQIRLLLSSRAEMQKVIETARQQSLAIQLQMQQSGSIPVTALPPKIQQPLPTPQPPVITSNSLHTILSNQANNYNPIQAYTSVSQQQKSSFVGSVEPARVSRETSRDQRRSGSRDRRRSRSNERGGSRRRRDRSRTRSRDRKLRRGSRRSRSRDRSSERGHERSRDRSNRDKDRNGSRGQRKDSRDNDSGFDRKKSDEKPFEKEPPKIAQPMNMWNVLPTNAYTTTSFAANYAAQALQSAAAAGVVDSEISSAFMNSNQISLKPSENNESIGNKSSAGSSVRDLSALSFLNVNQLENRPTFAFQNPYTQASNSQNTNTHNDSSQSSTMKDHNTNRFQQSNQFGQDGGSKNQESWPDAFGRNIPKSDANNRFDYQRKNDRKEIEEENSCVKISNMCSSTSYSDIRRFFSGLYIPNNGIKMINDDHGIRVGTAYIRFVRALNVPKALVRHGTLFKSKKISLVAVSDAEFSNAIDSYKPQRTNRFHANDNNRQNHDSPKYNDNKRDDFSFRDNSRDRSKNFDKPFSILIVKDIPPFSTQQDVMKMFSSYTIMDILLTNRPESRREIIAYVKFHRVEDAQAAYGEQRSHRINQRAVRVSVATEEEYEDAKEYTRLANEKELKEQKELEEMENLKRIAAEAEAEAEAIEQATKQEQEDQDDRSDHETEEGSAIPDQEDHEDEEGDAPIDNAEDDINQDSPQYAIDESNIDYDQSEENTEGSNNDQNKYSNAQKQGKGNPSNPFSGIPSLLDIAGDAKLTEPDLTIDPRLRQGRPSRFDNPNNDAQMNPTISNFVIIKNCEYKTSVQTVGEYFVSQNLIPNHVELLRNHRNQPCGEFIIELRSSQEAEQALRLNNNRLNSRPMRIYLISPQEIADRLNKPFMNFFPSGGNQQQQQQPNNNNMMMMNNQGARNNFNNMAGGNFSNNRNGNDRNNMYSPDNQGRNQNQNQFRGGNNNMMGPRGGNGPMSNPNQPNNRNVNRFANNSFDDANENISNKEIINLDCEPSEPDNTADDGMPEKFTRPGCVVEMENVPYRADLKDIIAFFDGYSVKAEDIIRRYNDDGSPTGDARVAFDSPEEAKGAYESKRLKQILNRTIFLNIL